MKRDGVIFVNEPEFIPYKAEISPSSTEEETVQSTINSEEEEEDEIKIIRRLRLKSEISSVGKFGYQTVEQVFDRAGITPELVVEYINMCRNVAFKNKYSAVYDQEIWNMVFTCVYRIEDTARICTLRQTR